MDKMALESPQTVDHSPEGAIWVEEWATWDDIPINITQMTGEEIQNTICTDGIIKGLEKIYYDNQFQNATFPSKADVDDYSRIIQHVRRMIDQSPEMSIFKTGNASRSGTLEPRTQVNNQMEELVPRKIQFLPK